MSGLPQENIVRKINMSAGDQDKTRLLFTFLFLPTILLGVFVIYPQFELIRLSFTDWNGIDKHLNYIGFENYWSLFFRSPEVWQSLQNNLLYFAVHIAVIPLEMLIAFIIDTRIRGSAVFRNLVFMPYVINGVAIAFMFNALYAPDYANGAINQVLVLMNGPDAVKDWLSDPSLVNWSLVFVSVWKYSGLHTVLFLAGMQSINRDLYEAASIDGAGRLSQFMAITLPGILPTVEVSLFLNARGAFQVFDIPFVMTGGGPGHVSSTFSVYTIETAFTFNNVGMACAMAITLLLLILAIAKMQEFIISRSHLNGK